MNPESLSDVLQSDTRYTIEAYEFVQEALYFAEQNLNMETEMKASEGEPDVEEPHFSGKQLCHAARCYALEQFGYMARVVLRQWGIGCTADIGEIVFNLIAQFLKLFFAD